MFLDFELGICNFLYVRELYIFILFISRDNCFGMNRILVKIGSFKAINLLDLK
jgi:hypothetical protein